MSRRDGSVDDQKTVDLHRLSEEATLLLDREDADLAETIQPTGLVPDDAATIVDGEPRPGAAPDAVAPGFELRDVLGEGGMGVVHLAHQRELGRHVAIKTLRGEFAGQRNERRSFLAESRVTGALQHPNVVPIHSVSETANGEIWLVMKRIEGRSLGELLADEPRPLGDARLERLLRIVLSVCNALAFAHSEGVLHRDIKPDNVMLGDYGEVLLVDWGIAVRYRDVDSESPLSSAPLAGQLRQVAGTPRYMAPEMARGDGAAQGPWSDMYLVGGLLYFLLSGSPPHSGRTLREVLQRAQSSEPAPLPDRVPRPLREICSKALASDPTQRYRSAEELRDAIETYLDHRESLVLAEQAQQELESWQDEVASGPVQDRARVYRRISQAISSFRHSNLLWPGNEEATEGERRGRLLMARKALELGDLGIAQNNLDGLEDDEAVELLAQLAAARSERERTTHVAGLLGGALVALQAVILAALAFFALYEVRRFTDTEIFEQLQRLRPAVELALQQQEEPTSADLDRLAEGIAQGDLGIALVGAEGNLLADSSIDPVGLDAAEIRSEIRDALALGEGRAIYEPEAGSDVLSTASRWTHGDHVGILVLSLPRDVLAEDLRPLLAATAVGLLLTFLLSALVTLRATRALHEALRRAL
ncbi:MAG: serine/threonine-protein kinase [Acidobacteriota bacterium]